MKLLVILSSLYTLANFQLSRSINWFNKYPILRLNFVFWVIVHNVADGAFKNLTNLDDILTKEQYLQQPFFRIVISNKPDPIKSLTFSSLKHHFTSLTKRDGFRDKLRVYGIRGGMINRLDRPLHSL
ncbi:uncharacterized protein N7506_004248 [Penicillium brevicompactum]|uniref:uncharacterized protein n=1 Tax=Penicillium brevicompactum TaxID=5074 RepID=UPI0025412EE7|nr:uncharacterized protein N7506_004248 [Penicillium brevicompactum]KAJ5336226.1 hypothetical protein N7506_004248 [Penicillium brevicompactum]